MRTGRLVLFAVSTALFLVSGCSSPGTISDEGSASVPAPAADVLTITAPDDGTVTNEKRVTVTGTAPDGADVVRDASFGFDQHATAAGGRWSMDVDLDDGQNLLRFRIGDDKSTEATLLITLSAAAEASSEPTSAGSPEPTAEETSTAVPEATPEPQPHPLSVKVTKRTTAVARNRTASVTIKTAKGARCSITVEYNSGPSEASGLGPKTANSSARRSMLVRARPTPANARMSRSNRRSRNQRSHLKGGMQLTRSIQ